MTTDLSLLDDDSEIGLAQQEGLALIAEAEALRITDQASFQAAGVFRKRIKAHIEMVKGFWGPKKARSRGVWQADVDDEKRMLEGPEAVLKIINDGMTAHERAMARERAIAEARAAEEAKRLEAARPLPPAGTAPLPPIIVPAAYVETPKVEGLSFSTHYKGVVIDKSALIKAVAEGKVSDSALDAVEGVLKDWARTAGPNTAAAANPGTVYPMPGVPGVGVMAERRPRG